MEKMIRHYKIVREIGKGGMGIVYKGIDPKDHKAVAIKILPPTMVNRAAVERFHREAQAMARLQHPNLLSVYDVGMEKGEHYLVMEYIEGQTLKALLKHEGALNAKDMLSMSAQIADAIAYIHKEGLIHRDIKPGNIMITTDDVVKVMDFGLVKIPGITNVTVSGSAVGTAEYMSPEQVSGEEVDSRTDIYSFGVTMYEMLIGNPPFSGDSVQSILMKHKYESVPPLRETNPNIPPQVEMIVMRAMAKDIAQRYQKAGELYADINRLIEPETTAGHQALSEKTTEIVPPSAAKQKEKTTTVSAPKKIPIKPIVGVIVIIGAVLLWRNYHAEIMSLYSNVISKVQGKKEDSATLVSQTKSQLKELEVADEHYILGLKYYSSGSFARAIAEYKKAIDLRPDYAPYYRDLAAAYEKNGEKSKAIGTLEDLLYYDGTSPHADFARRKIKELTSQ